MKQRPSQFKRYLNLLRNTKNPQKYLFYKFGLVREDPLVFILKNGMHVSVPIVQLTAFKSIVMNESYFRGFKRDAFSVSLQTCFLDIGANLGFFSLFVKDRYPLCSVYSVEPLKVNYEWMINNFKTNKGCAFNPINAALASKKGVLLLYLSVSREERFPTSATILKTDNMKKSYKVPSLSLRDLLVEKKVLEVDLLKLDCEGAEYEVLYSSDKDTLNKIKNIAMEVHKGNAGNQNIEALGSFLNDAGYAYRASADRHYLWASRDPKKLIYLVFGIILSTYNSHPEKNLKSFSKKGQISLPPRSVLKYRVIKLG